MTRTIGTPAGNSRKKQRNLCKTTTVPVALEKSEFDARDEDEAGSKDELNFLTLNSARRLLRSGQDRNKKRIPERQEVS